METQREFDYTNHNRKIAKLRGLKWRESLRKAKIRPDNELRAMAIARHELGYTQADMMKFLGTKNNTIYARIERGDMATRRDRAELIAKTLKKKVTDLFIEFDKNKFLAI